MMKFKKNAKKVITIKEGNVLDTKFGTRIVVAGKSYGEEKFMTVDMKGNLKSRVCDTQEALLKGYNAAIVGQVGLDEEVDKTLITVGTRFLIKTKNHGDQVRLLCGGTSYGKKLYFTVNKDNKRRSRILSSIEEVLDGYDIIGILG